MVIFDYTKTAGENLKKLHGYSERIEQLQEQMKISVDDAISFYEVIAMATMQHTNFGDAEGLERTVAEIGKLLRAKGAIV